jgi:hypothetical protein
MEFVKLLNMELKNLVFIESKNMSRTGDYKLQL